MATIHRVTHPAHHAQPHAPSKRAKEMLAAAKGTFPTVILDDKLASKVEHMRPTQSAHETAKGGTVNLVYHFKTPAEAKAVYESATESYNGGKRFVSPSLGDNIAEQLDTAQEVGDPKLTVRGSNLVLSVQFKPA